MKYIKLYEELSPVETLINWSLIDDVKDMALEYIDVGFTLNVTVKLRVRIYSTLTDNAVYNLKYNHDIKIEFKVWEDATSAIKLKHFYDIANFNKIIYEIHLTYDHHTFHSDILKQHTLALARMRSYDLAERAIEAYPNENIRYEIH